MFFKKGERTGPPIIKEYQPKTLPRGQIQVPNHVPNDRLQSYQRWKRDQELLRRNRKVLERWSERKYDADSAKLDMERDHVLADEVRENVECIPDRPVNCHDFMETSGENTGLKHARMRLQNFRKKDQVLLQQVHEIERDIEAYDNVMCT